MILNESELSFLNNTTVPGIQFNEFTGYTIIAAGIVIVGLFGFLIYWGQAGGGGD